MKVLLILLVFLPSLCNSQNIIFGRDAAPLNGELINDNFMFYSRSKSALRAPALIGSANWSPDSIGTWSIALGVDSKAKGLASLALGNAAAAEGINSTAIGFVTRAIGDYSTAFGQRTIASSFSEMVFGSNNTTFTPLSYDSWIDEDRLFVIGNGPDINNKSDAMVLLKNGDVIFPEGSFLVGRDSMPKNGEAIDDQMMFYDEIKSSFQGGILQNSKNWSPDSTGFMSFAYGNNTLARGFGTFAIGSETKATGPLAFASGSQTTASGDVSFAGGFQTIASGTNAFAIGLGNLASGYNSFSSGLDNAASGTNSFATGDFTIASGSGSFSSGIGTKARSYAETAMGVWNTDYIPLDENSRNTEDRLLVVGNGENSSNRSDAMVLMKNGDVRFPDGNFLVGRDSIPKNGEVMFHKLMLYNNTKSAFRGGEMRFSSMWSPDSIGDNSLAYGRNVRAKGEASAAFGIGSIAGSFSEFTLGTYNTEYPVNNSIGWTAEDRLFVIGNGTSSGVRSDAMVVLKNGNTTFNGKATVNGDVNVSGQLIIDESVSDVELSMRSSGITTGRVLMRGNGSNHVYIGDIDANNGATIIKTNGQDRIIFGVSGDIAVKNGDFYSQTSTNDLGQSVKSWNTAWLLNGINNTSDKRLKKNIKSVGYGLKELIDLNPVMYEWKDHDDGVKLGLIAQELKEIIPEVVHTPENPEEYMSVSYSELIPVLIKSIQEQQEIITSQEKENEDQSKLISDLLSRIEQIESSINSKSGGSKTAEKAY